MSEWNEAIQKMQAEQKVMSRSELVRRLREAREAARYQPGDHSILPVKIGRFLQEVDAILEAAAALEGDAQPVAVKALEWTQAPNEAGKQGLWFVALDVFGDDHQVIKTWHGQKGEGWDYRGGFYPTIEAAQAVAQTSVAQRIRSALVATPPSPKLGVADFLFKLLDDIDTLDDACRGDDKAFRARVREVQRRRFEVAQTDGYTVTFKTKDHDNG